MGELQETLKELAKKYGSHTIIDPEVLKRTKLERVSTGSLALDLEIGGGWPLGRVVEVHGWESCGKTMLALKAASEVQKLGRPVVWIDQERAFDPEWSKILGVDIDKITVVQPNTGEEAADFVDAVTRSGDCGLVVLDSVAAMLPSMDNETPMTEVEKIGDRALMMNRLIRKLHSAINVRADDGTLNQCLVFLINQLRYKVGVMYGPNTTTPGGMGIKFASSITVEMRTGEWIEDDKDGEKVKIGRHFKGRTDKNKTFPPYRTAEIPFYFSGENQGQIDNAESMARYALMLGLVTQKGSFFQAGEEKLQGKAGLAEFFRDGKNYKKYEKEIKELYLKK